MQRMLIIVFIFAFYFISGNAHAKLISPEEVDEVLATYEQNQVRFNHNYKGKKFEGRVSVDSVVEDIFSKGSYYILFNAAASKQIQCALIRDKKTINQIMSFNKGDEMVITGTIEDVLLSGDLELTRCKFKQ